MNIHLPFFRGNMSLAYSTLSSTTLQDEKIIPLNSRFYAFTGPGFINNPQSNDTELYSFPGDKQITDNKLGKKEIQNVIQNRIAIQGEGELGSVVENPRSIWVWIASTSLILLFAFTIIQNRVRNHEIDTLYKKYFVVSDPIIINSIGSQPVYYEEFIESLDLMQKNQYQKALDKLSIMKNKLGSLSDINYYSGLCYLKLGNIHSALLLFEEIKNRKDVSAKKAGEIIPNLKTME